MTGLAAPLQNRRNILRERYVTWRRSRLPPNARWYEETRENRNEPHHIEAARYRACATQATRRGARPQRTSDSHSHTSLNPRVLERNVTPKRPSIQVLRLSPRRTATAS